MSTPSITIPDIEISSTPLKSPALSIQIVTNIEAKKFTDTVSKTLNDISDAVGDVSLEKAGISASPPISIGIDIDNFVKREDMRPSWMYMTKVDMNVYLSTMIPNYGQYTAIKTKGLKVTCAPDFNNLDSNKGLSIVSSYSGDFNYFDENNELKLSSGTNLSVLKTIDTDNDGYYRWCTVYACERNLASSDVLSDLRLKYLAQSDKDCKVLNGLSTQIYSMDFSFSNEPFLVTKDYDYIFIMRTKHIPDISAYSLFSEESLSSATYFRCSQFPLKDEIDIKYMGSVQHGNCWLGWNALSNMMPQLSSKNMNWVWTGQTSPIDAAEHAHKYISPFNLVKDKDGYTLLSATIVTKEIADQIYANTTCYSVDGKPTHINKLKINEFSSIEQYNRRVKEENEHELYILKNPSINAGNSAIRNVGDPVDDHDAATKQYADVMNSVLSTALFTSLKDIDMSNVTELEDVINVLSNIVQHFNR